MEEDKGVDKVSVNGKIRSEKITIFEKAFHSTKFDTFSDAIK